VSGSKVLCQTDARAKRTRPLSGAAKAAPREVHPTAQRFQAQLHELGLEAEVRELSESTRTAADAAAAVGVEVGQIVKSLVFMDGDEPLLVLCAGDRRVDVERLGAEVRQARGVEVRDATGFAIGGVPPLGHGRPVRTIVDESLRRFETVWCAAGTPNAVFRVETNELIRTIPGAAVREISAGFPA
jgi:prolyl-tRNA editing enzyme YbaK/EbsC (Cys-tRNA(Pro) deacylase)